MQKEGEKRQKNYERFSHRARNEPYVKFSLALSNFQLAPLHLAAEIYVRTMRYRCKLLIEQLGIAHFSYSDNKIMLSTQ